MCLGQYRIHSPLSILQWKPVGVSSSLCPMPVHVTVYIPRATGCVRPCAPCFHTWPSTCPLLVWVWVCCLLQRVAVDVPLACACGCPFDRVLKYAPFMFFSCASACVCSYAPPLSGAQPVQRADGRVGGKAGHGWRPRARREGQGRQGHAALEECTPHPHPTPLKSCMAGRSRGSRGKGFGLTRAESNC